MDTLPLNIQKILTRLGEDLDTISSWARTAHGRYKGQVSADKIRRLPWIGIKKAKLIKEAIDTR